MAKKIKFEKPSTKLMCPIGSHVVKGHYRKCASGTKTWVDTHVRKNRSKKNKKKVMYLPENLLYIFWNSKKKYPNLKKIKGFPPHNEIDGLIQFWFDYWKSQGLKFHPSMKPLHIKALIATESSFRTHVSAGSSTATGLMQLLAPTLQRLKGVKHNNYREVDSQFVSISKKERKDPVLNIAAGTRWLSHKYEQLLKIRKNKGVSLKEAIKYYHSWDEEGEKYADKILRLYKESR